MPCMCGATDCPSCGPAQGYRIVRRVVNGHWVYVNPDDEDDDESFAEDVEADEHHEREAERRKYDE